MLTYIEQTFFMVVVELHGLIILPLSFFHVKFHTNQSFLQCTSIFRFFSELAYISKGDAEVIYWEVAYPWPMSNRDVSFTHICIPSC